MRKTIVVVLALALILAFNSEVLAQKSGTTSSQLFRIFLNARGAGMGEAFGGVVGDANALRANPAGLAAFGQLKPGLEFTVGHVSWALNMNLNYGIVAIPRELGTFGIGIIMFDQSSIDASDDWGVEIPHQSYSAKDIAVSLGFGRSITNLIDVGADVVYVHSGLGPSSANYFTLDLGLLAHFGEAYKYNVGLAIKNIGTKVKYGVLESDQPTLINLGLGANLFATETKTFSLGLFADANIPLKADPFFNVGAEGWLFDMIALRAGYKIGNDVIGYGSEGGLTFGVGFKFSDLISFDYAYNDLKDFGKAHRFATTFTFAPPKPKEIPLIDSDGDGIYDDDDQCKDQPEDVDNWQDADGCPDPDNDGDGILDVDDKCPIIPEIYNEYMDDDGCPDVAPLKEEVTKRPPGAEEPTVLLPTVYFDFDSYRIRPDAAATLDEVARILLERYPGKSVVVAAHTDALGSDEYNMELSRKRANSVIDYLAKKGVPKTLLTPVGYGETKPVASNDTEEGRQKNRRVEFIINTGTGGFTLY